MRAIGLFGMKKELRSGLPGTSMTAVAPNDAVPTQVGIDLHQWLAVQVLGQAAIDLARSR